MIISHQLVHLNELNLKPINMCQRLHDKTSVAFRIRSVWYK